MKNLFDLTNPQEKPFNYFTKKIIEYKLNIKKYPKINLGEEITKYSKLNSLDQKETELIQALALIIQGLVKLTGDRIAVK
jgi:hypothetical protein